MDVISADLKDTMAGKVPSGKKRAARNIGAHESPGCGPEALAAALAEPQPFQRGGEVADGAGPSHDSPRAIPGSVDNGE
eukprot:10920399-Prorocentrum_lima.AAC.1